MSEARPPDAHYLTLAGKYWSKTLDSFDRAFAVAIPGPSSYEALIDAVTAGDVDPQPD